MHPPLKPFASMTDQDYFDIGLKCGLEVHQQLLTPTKLFCRCPAGRYSGEYDAEILRHMRPTLSELGEYDGTALMEKKTRKNIFYRIHHHTVCTYEFDDTPPFFISDVALEIALELALLLRLSLVNEVHIARKQYLDGSIPTGFQRTTILGVGGWIPYRDRRIGITQLGLEEDSCREVSDQGHDRVLLTDRLGMPLIEVVTDPDMRTPQEMADVCQIIRRLCRSTGKVRTGYGAAREDVNVSVRGGTRVEIKGVPQIVRIPHLVYNEACRQWSLLGIRDELHRRGVTPETFSCRVQDASRVLARTQYQPLRAALDAGMHVRCAILPGFVGVLNTQTQEHTTFAREFSDRVRVIACLTDLPNIVHSDTAAECLTAREWKELRRKTAAAEQDALILVWGSEQDVQTACNEITIRAREATVGVPSDTRQALKDGTNGFERVLPGAERMYPDTDLPPIALTAERVEAARRRLPRFVWDRENAYRELNLPHDVLVPLCISPRANLFDRLVQELRVDPVFAAVVLIQRLKALRRAGRRVDLLRDEDIFETFRAFVDARLTREGLVQVLEELARERPQGAAEVPVVDLIAEIGGKPPSDQELDLQIGELLNGLDERRFATPTKRYRYVMGELMRPHLGRIDGRRLSERLAARLRLSGGVQSEKVGA